MFDLFLLVCFSDILMRLHRENIAQKINCTPRIFIFIYLCNNELYIFFQWFFIAGCFSEFLLKTLYYYEVHDTDIGAVVPLVIREIYYRNAEYVTVRVVLL